MLFTKAALIFSSLVVLTVAQDADASSKGLAPGRGRTPNPSSRNKLMSKRDLEKRCTGTCAECFGDGYTLCPGSSIFCYLPGDASYGLDSCSSDGSSDSTPTTSASSSSSTGTSGVDDICYQTGATCQSCFGPTYIDCPDGYHCYDPNDPDYDTCPDDGSSSSGSGGSSSGGTTVSSCASLYGTGNIPCGTDACYNPDIGESCCAGGYYCDAGYTCSSTIGKCSLGGSGSSGSSSTFDSNLLSTSSYNYGTYSTTNGFGATTPTSTGSGSSSTGINLSSDSSDANAITAGGLGRGLLVLAAMGVGMLVL